MVQRLGLTRIGRSGGVYRLAGRLPGNHRDPLDRIVAAQALEEGQTVITRDREMAAFGREVLW